MGRRSNGRAEISVESFDKGLVTLVPSETAGQIAAIPAGQVPLSPQMSNVQFGPDQKNAVTRASNVRFENGAALGAPGAEAVEIPTIESPILIYQSRQSGDDISNGSFLVLGTRDGIYIARGS